MIKTTNIIVNIEDCIKGEIYSLSYSWQERTIIIYNTNMIGMISMPNSDSFSKENFHTCYSKIYQASQEEKHWIRECIKANIFIPYNKLIFPELVINNYLLY